MARTVVPIADLRREPHELLPKNFDHHALRDSQILYNEKIEILEIVGRWVHVAAVEQMRFTDKWEPYEGWLHQSEIGEGKIVPKFVVYDSSEYSYGTYSESPLPGARPLSSTFDRKQLVDDAKRFLGAPYLWGGRSSYFSTPIASVDCSSLIHLLYRAQGISIPRDAHDQYLFGKPSTELKPGDPLYLAKGERINHVILKLEEGLFIEAPESGKHVRLLKEGEDLWQKDGRWHFFDRPDTYKGFSISLTV